MGQHVLPRLYGCRRLCLCLIWVYCMLVFARLFNVFFVVVCCRVKISRRGRKVFVVSVIRAAFQSASYGHHSQSGVRYICITRLWKTLISSSLRDPRHCLLYHVSTFVFFNHRDWRQYTFLWSSLIYSSSMNISYNMFNCSWLFSETCLGLIAWLMSNPV